MAPKWRNMTTLIAFISIFVIAFPSILCQSVDDLIKQVFSTLPENSMIPNLNTNSDIETNSDCKCVPYYLCDNGTINANGDGIIDIRMKDDSICTGYLDICCNQTNVQQEPLIPEKPEIQSGCGHRNLKGIQFQITGNTDNESEFGEFPWMVALLNTNSERNYQCGASLIHYKVVLTTAHCVKGKNINKIRAGEWDTQITTEPYPHQDVEVESIVIHPRYDPGGLKNDIALLFLKSPVIPAPHIGLICLPPMETIEMEHVRCFATGWGKDVFGKEGKYQVILKKIDLPMVNREDCQSALRKTRLGNYFELHESFICAGGEIGKDTCQGDGGSPLVCPIKGENNEVSYFQFGMVAWGIGCGTTVPGVYVNVPLFRKWIDEQISHHNLELTL